jgi:hypothetical protein
MLRKWSVCFSYRNGALSLLFHTLVNPCSLGRMFTGRWTKKHGSLYLSEVAVYLDNTGRGRVIPVITTSEPFEDKISMTE